MLSKLKYWQEVVEWVYLIQASKEVFTLQKSTHTNLLPLFHITIEKKLSF